jgi:hypothetical protein
LTVLRFLVLPRWRGKAGEARVGRALERLFPAVTHDAILPDARGGLTQIDHLALTPAGILVVETKHYRGRIFGQAHEATWTQTIGRQRNRFQNPLRQNHAHACAVEAIAEGVPVLRRVVFTNAAEFPNGRCSGVSQLATLDADLRDWRRGEISPALQQAWQRLLASARTDREARRAHLEGLRARHGKRAPGLGRWALAPIVIVAALALTGPWRTASQPQRPLARPTPTPAWSVETGSAPPRVRPSSPVERPLHSAQPQPQAVATIEWAGRSPTGESESQACKEAIMATLIANTDENRSRRTIACGRPSNGSEP